MADKSITHVIIPAAGFGKRVGLSKSKELLYYKSEKFKIIEWSLRLCKKYEMLPVVISRKDKQDLNTFLSSYGSELKLCLVEASEEWTHSVCLSVDYWADKNILLLPDSRFAPVHILKKIDQSLRKFDLSFATFKVQDPAQWGIVLPRDLEIAEKPSKITKQFLAWGLIGFKKQAGLSLFEDLRISSKDRIFKKIKTQNVDFIPLESYQDITRSAIDLKVNLE